MGKDSGIQWTHHTFNPWWGCVKISPACANCYAATLDKRVGGKHWGAETERRFFGDKHWNEPLKWNAAAEKAGERHLVFCASMADVFEDRSDVEPHRQRLWKLIADTPHLDWLLLTKRPENIAGMLPVYWKEFQQHNVWLGTTAESQEWYDKRVPHLMNANAVVHFLSVEPMLGPVVIGHPVDWVICGGESGHGARVLNFNHAESLKAQCEFIGAAFFMKQLGERFDNGSVIEHLDRSTMGDIETFPERLRVREFPKIPHFSGNK